MADMAKNLIYYNMLSQKASGEINKLESAIKGQ
jgi:flagellar basal body rod protein FlgB